MNRCVSNKNADLLMKFIIMTTAQALDKTIVDFCTIVWQRPFFGSLISNSPTIINMFLGKIEQSIYNLTCSLININLLT